MSGVSTVPLYMVREPKKTSWDMSKGVYRPGLEVDLNIFESIFLALNFMRTHIL